MRIHLDCKGFADEGMGINGQDLRAEPLGSNVTEFSASRQQNFCVLFDLKQVQHGVCAVPSIGVAIHSTARGRRCLEVK